MININNIHIRNIIIFFLGLYSVHSLVAQDKFINLIDTVGKTAQEIEYMKNHWIQDQHGNWITYKDWRVMDPPNINRFRDENARLQPPVKGEKRVIFFGHSIVDGWLDYYAIYFEQHKNYFMRAVSGQTTASMLARFRQDAVDLKPKVVILLAGTNDIAGNDGPCGLEMIESNIASMVDIARQNKIRVILSTELPCNHYFWNPNINPGETIAKLNDWIRNYAKENKLGFIDFYTPMVDNEKGLKKEYSVDGVHPNKAGYEVMSPLCEQAIDKALKRKAAKK